MKPYKYALYTVSEGGKTLERCFRSNYPDLDQFDERCDIVQGSNQIIEETLNPLWMQGKFPGIGAEINTAIPYFSYGDFFAQGDEADEIIDEIHTIWMMENCTSEEAIIRWGANNL